MKNYCRYSLTILLTASFLCINSCAQKEPEMTGEKIQRAVAVLTPTEGSAVHGMVTFARAGLGIYVTADIIGLTPGKHGFHIHEYGDISAIDAKTAGGHFNPDKQAHGAPTDQVRHVGDLGNVVADTNGEAHLEWTDTIIKFSGPHNIIGRSVIVHAGADDLTTQPTGNAGSRVACGVIGIAATPK
jgi:Cu-Zn family superoxide dismutase